MKRESVKPVIESEEFVANEYVAACWRLTCETPYCNYNKYNVIIGGDKYSANDLEQCVNDYNDNNTVHKGGDRPYESSSSYYHIGGFQTELAAHHTLTVQLVSSGEKHPNASA